MGRKLPKPRQTVPQPKITCKRQFPDCPPSMHEGCKGCPLYVK